MLSLILLAAAGTPTADVYFEFDSARLPEGTSVRLREIAEYAESNPEAKIIIDGHADYIGTPEYNVGLSLRRAKSIRAQLVLLGVPEDRMYLVGYGEDGVPRDTRAEERRVTVWTTEEPLYAVVDNALVRGITVIWEEPVIAAQIEGPPQPTQVTFR